MAYSFNSGSTGARKDPYSSFRFHVELTGLIVAGFSEVSGISSRTEVERVMEGGRNNGEHVLIKYTKYSDLELSRGMGDMDMLYGWYLAVTQGKVVRLSGSIYLMDEAQTPTAYWIFYNALPVAWEGPSLNAQSDAVPIEKLSLAHEGLVRIY